MLRQPSHGSWGRPRSEIDARVLRLWCRALTTLGNVGEILHLPMVAALVLFAASLLMGINFENIIFYDGTAITCVLDGDTQGSTNVR